MFELKYISLLIDVVLFKQFRFCDVNFDEEIKLWKAVEAQTFISSIHSAVFLTNLHFNESLIDWIE